MGGTFAWPGSTGAGVPTFANLAAFPSAITSGNGSLAIALDSNILYESNGTTWLAIAQPGDALTLAAFGSTPNANGLSLSAGGALGMQPADGTHPGGVSIGAQTIAGVKTFSSAPNLSSLSASLPLQLDGSKNVTAAAVNVSGAQITGVLAATSFPAMTGDVTSSAGALATTISPNVVTNANLAQMATHTIKGNNTGGTANALDLTVAQVNTLLGVLTNPMTTLGDTIYEDATPTPARLAGNTTSTKKFLTQTGTGSVSAVPGWNTIVAADVPSLAASIITSGTLATARGGTNSDSSASTGIAHVSSGSWTYSAVDLSGADATGVLAAARFPALTGDITTSAGALATTAAATQANITSLSNTSGVAIHGTNTNNNASAGFFGEYIESLVSTFTSMTAATNHWQDLTSISLTAGDWDVTLLVQVQSQATASLATIIGGISTTTGDFNTGLVIGSNEIEFDLNAGLNNGNSMSVSIPNYRVSLSGTVIHYGKILATYATTAPKFVCRLSARRVR